MHNVLNSMSIEYSLFELGEYRLVELCGPFQSISDTTSLLQRDNHSTSGNNGLNGKRLKSLKISMHRYSDEHTKVVAEYAQLLEFFDP